MIHYPITPVPYTRINKNTPRSTPRVVKYNNFKAEVKRYGVVVPCERPYLTFVIPTPDERLWGCPHRVTRRHDLDNLVKALFDACLILSNEGDAVDDGFVSELLASKEWGESGSISVAQYGRPIYKFAPKIQLVAPIEPNN